MGNLVIKKVKYSGEKYSFDSPELTTGINIIVGDNGSGKSTFTYFIEYALGGRVKAFDRNGTKNKYTEIVNDINNFVELEIAIDSNTYGIKRFIGGNAVYVKDGESVYEFPISRNASPNIFSDWLLKKLDIPVFELNSGAYTWKFNFNDLFRLLCYDQDTELRKIYKSPANDNFITDLSIIRKSTFEVLLGISSIEFFKKTDELKEAEKRKSLAKSLKTDFQALHNEISKETVSEVESRIQELNDQINRLFKERDLYQKENTKVNDKTLHLAKIQAELINIDIQISEDKVKINNYQSEYFKIEQLHSGLEQEISEINKTIFTNDKLNLFSMEFCPFCGKKNQKHKDGLCVCGSELKDDEYEKYIYSSSEYKEILKYKKKSLETISKAKESYNEEIKGLKRKVKTNGEKSTDLKNKLKRIINAIEYSGNSQFIDSLNDEIFDAKLKVQDEEEILKLVIQQDKLESEYTKAVLHYQKINEVHKILETKYKKENAKTIEAFNTIYNQLMQNSSCKCSHAQIDEDYMPYVDSGDYRNKSADVPKRLMYYFTTLSLSLKFNSVKHPKFLLIDTPGAAGIDDDNLKADLKLLDKALELSKNKSNDTVGEYQVILTTGQNKFPEQYSSYVKVEFSRSNGEYILQKTK